MVHTRTTQFWAPLNLAWILCIAAGGILCQVDVALSRLAFFAGASGYGYRDQQSGTAHISMCIAKKQYYLHYLKQSTSTVTILQNVDVEEYRMGRFTTDGTLCVDSPKVTVNLRMGCVDGEVVGEPFVWNVTVGSAVGGQYLRDYAELLRSVSRRRLDSPIGAARIRIVLLASREKTIAWDENDYSEHSPVVHAHAGRTRRAPQASEGSDSASQHASVVTSPPVFKDGLAGRSSFYSKTDRSANAGTHFHDMLVREVEAIEGASHTLPQMGPILAAFFGPHIDRVYSLSVDVNAVVMVVTHQLMAMRAVGKRGGSAKGGQEEEYGVDVPSLTTPAPEERPPVCSGSYVSSAAFGRRVWMRAALRVRQATDTKLSEQIQYEGTDELSQEALGVFIDLAEGFNTSELFRRCPWQRNVNGKPSLDPSDFEMWAACRVGYVEALVAKALSHPFTSDEDEDLSFKAKRRRLVAAVALAAADVNATLRWHWPSEAARAAVAHRWWDCRSPRPCVGGVRTGGSGDAAVGAEDATHCAANTPSSASVWSPSSFSCVDAGDGVSQCTLNIEDGGIVDFVCALGSVAALHADGRYFAVEDAKEGKSIPFEDELLAARVQQNGTLVSFQYSRCAAGPLPPLRTVLVMSRVTFLSSVFIVALTMIMLYLMMGQTVRLLTYGGFRLWPILHLHSANFTFHFLYMWPWELQWTRRDQHDRRQRNADMVHAMGPFGGGDPMALAADGGLDVARPAPPPALD